MNQRRRIVEAPLMQREYSSNKPQWQVIETRVEGTAIIQVSELPLKIPRYSFRVGTAQFDERTREVKVGPFLTTFNVLDAAKLVTELGEKYCNLREDKIDDLEQQKQSILTEGHILSDVEDL